MSISLQISPNQNIFLRDPQDTKLGISILHSSVELIHSQGFEQFNFKKLAECMGSTEASVYRYFTNKYQLFAYLTALFWEWQSFRFLLHTNNISEPREKLQIALKLLAQGEGDKALLTILNSEKLHFIMIEQGNKIYHTDLTDENNSKGFYLSYKQYSETIAELIININPDYLYPHALATTLIESMFNHIYYANHLPRLTDFAKSETPEEDIYKMLLDLVQRVLG